MAIPSSLQLHPSQNARLSLQAWMVKPVIAADGYTYENEAIVSWLQAHDTSPGTSRRLTHMHLVDNAVMRNLIQQQLKR